jgi:hypothetical protein
MDARKREPHLLAYADTGGMRFAWLLLVGNGSRASQSHAAATPRLLVRIGAPEKRRREVFGWWVVCSDGMGWDG